MAAADPHLANTADTKVDTDVDPQGQHAAAEPPAPIISQARTGLSAQAEEFKPTGSTRADILAILPPPHRAMLRVGFQDLATGDWCPYYVGSLKTFSSKSGYGFIECAQAYSEWGVDVFLHKNNVPTPWTIGQPVEFAINVNSRGQPQAQDTQWLPLLPQSRHGAQGVQTLRHAIAPAPTQIRVEEESAEAVAETGEAEPAARPRRHLGSLKSFSVGQGYGFIACDDVAQEYGRDTYVDKSQLPLEGRWQLGQTVEFAVTLNARGFPQARHVDWDPIPLLPGEPSKAPASVAATGGAAARTQATQASQPGVAQSKSHTLEALDKTKQLLALLRDAQFETAIVNAIGFQGEAGEADVDFVTFVLDRLGPEKQAMATIKDFVKMLLLLMLAKMIRKPVGEKRSRQQLRWLEALSLAIDATVDGVAEHFQDVVAQIKNHVSVAQRENADLQDALLGIALREISTRLVDKSKNGDSAHESPPSSDVATPALQASEARSTST